MADLEHLCIDLYNLCTKNSKEDALLSLRYMCQKITETYLIEVGDPLMKAANEKIRLAKEMAIEAKEKEDHYRHLIFLESRKSTNQIKLEVLKRLQQRIGEASAQVNEEIRDIKIALEHTQ